MDDNRWANWTSSQSSHGPRLERCLIGAEEVSLPEALIEQTDIFRHVMSQETWDNILSEDQRKRLESLLPSFPGDNDADEKSETIRQLFSGANFKFGNPLQQVHKLLKDGFLQPDIVRYRRLCKKLKFQEYKNFQQNYHSELLQEILISRQRTMGLLNGLPPDQPLRFHHSPPQDPHKGLESRVRKNYVRVLKEAREECGPDETSSEEEDSVSPVQKSRRQLFKSLGPIPSPEPTTPSVVATYASKPSTFNGDISGCNNSKRPRPISPVEIHDYDYRQMLRNHKRKKLETPDLPELDTQGITLQDILGRCQASKKSTKSPTVNGDPSAENASATAPLKKKRVRDKSDHKLKRKIKTEKGVEPTGEKETTLAASNVNLDVHSELLTHRDDDGVPDFPLPDTLPSRLTLGQADSFFSLLRDMICEFSDSKVTTAKLEERVREWQESPASALNSWVHQQQNWVDWVVSALKFLSGDVLGLSVENFVPLLDYKERAQQWKWIGAGRDSNQQLASLFRHWMKHKDIAPIDGLDAGQGSPPPARTKTSFVVRQTTSAEKAAFRDQESQRFVNPHRAFTYRLHGYESVVGPVKGVYNKDNAMTKAREHTLLTSDRPAYVTILTLVRDAAARMPNGEGTRNDICELLKDSHFLAPNVTDTQINTVVSGALDRLHSEKDPCVKYDVNQKLWIYLHRSRTEEEFERIHQAQGAAMKAKKSLQRPKASKAIKDQVASQSTGTAAKTTLSQGAGTAASGATDLARDEFSSLSASSLTTMPSPRGLSPFAQKLNSKQNTAFIAQKTAQGTLGSSPAGSQATVGQLSMTMASASPAVGATGQGNNRRPVSQVIKTEQASTVAGKLSVAKPRAGMRVAQTAATAMLGARTPVAAPAVQGHTALQQPSLQQNASLLTNLKPTSALATGVTKPPVVAVTKQGLTALSRQVNMTEAQTGASSPVSQSPVIVTQEAALRSSASSLAASSGVSSKIMTLNQTVVPANATVTAPITGDNAMVARLVQQQVFSVGSLQQRGTTFKIQGSNIMQPLIGTKPVQFAGKPLATKGLLQLGGKGAQPLNVLQTAQLQTLSLIPQALTAGTMVSSANSGNNNKLSGNVTTVATASGSSSPVTFTMVGSPSSIAAQAKTTILTHVATTGATTSQAKLVTPAQAGMVVTQLPPGSISLRPGLPGTSQAKMVAGQPGLVPAQFIVQQTSGASAGQGTPQGIIVTQAGGKGGTQNIQVVRTVLSQPGQATILISQPTLQHAAAASGAVLSSTQVIHTTGCATSSKASGRGSPKGKAHPVYARIITPPPGMKLTTVGPAQVSAAGNVNVLQTVSKLLAGLPNAAVAAGNGSSPQNITTVTIATPSGSPTVALATNHPSSAGVQSVIRTDSSDGSISGGTSS